MFDVEKIRAEFPILNRTDEKGKTLAYLDSGATAQKPQCVIDKDQLHLTRQVNSNVHRGVHKLSAICTTEYEEAREEIRSFIGAGSAQEVIFTAGATASINLVASSYGERFVGRGDGRSLSPKWSTMPTSFRGSYWPSAKGPSSRVLPFRDHGELETDKLDELLTDRTKVVAVTQASNVLGHACPTCAFGRRRGAPCRGDAPCSSTDARGSCIRRSRRDRAAIATSTPSPDTSSTARPGSACSTAEEQLHGARCRLRTWAGATWWRTVSFAGTTYAELPLKFEAGTADYVGAIGLGEADPLRGRRERSGGSCGSPRARTDWPTPPRSSRAGSTACVIYGTQLRASAASCRLRPDRGASLRPVGMILDKQGVALRTGTHCAEPVMAHYGITAHGAGVAGHVQYLRRDRYACRGPEAGGTHAALLRRGPSSVSFRPGPGGEERAPDSASRLGEPFVVLEWI